MTSGETRQCTGNGMPAARTDAVLLPFHARVRRFHLQLPVANRRMDCRLQGALYSLARTPREVKCRTVPRDGKRPRGGPPEAVARRRDRRRVAPSCPHLTLAPLCRGRRSGRIPRITAIRTTKSDRGSCCGQASSTNRMVRPTLPRGGQHTDSESALFREQSVRIQEGCEGRPRRRRPT